MFSFFTKLCKCYSR